MTFEAAVRAAPSPVNGAYRPGKQALEKRHRKHVTCVDSLRLTGSLDLDGALAREPRYAKQPRWDYGLGYKPSRGKEQAVWVEVHSATTGEVSAVLGKLQWLRDWLSAEAGWLKRLTDHAGEDIRFVWIASAGDRISRNSPQFRRLSQSGLRLKERLALP
ncbi:MAG: hypothetical protein J4F33_10615 [Alphaproteobacteria bacterium]|nr:hypothetical protein [Alphaproteobacteria bacterium]